MEAPGPIPDLPSPEGDLREQVIREGAQKIRTLLVALEGGWNPLRGFLLIQNQAESTLMQLKELGNAPPPAGNPPPGGNMMTDVAEWFRQMMGLLEGMGMSSSRRDRGAEARNLLDALQVATKAGETEIAASLRARIEAVLSEAADPAPVPRIVLDAADASGAADGLAAEEELAAVVGPWTTICEAEPGVVVAHCLWSGCDAPVTWVRQTPSLGVVLFCTEHACAHPDWPEDSKWSPFRPVVEHCGWGGCDAPVTWARQWRPGTPGLGASPVAVLLCTEHARVHTDWPEDPNWSPIWPEAFKLAADLSGPQRLALHVLHESGVDGWADVERRPRERIEELGLVDNLNYELTALGKQVLRYVERPARADTILKTIANRRSALEGGAS